MNLETYLDSVSNKDTVVVIGKKIKGVRLSTVSEKLEDCDMHLVGVEVQAWLFTPNAFREISTSTLLWCLSRIRGEGVEPQKSKIGVLYKFSGCDYINWL